MTDRAAESHHAAYVAVGVWHEFLVTGDRDFAERMWPVSPRRDRLGARPAGAARRGGVGTRRRGTPRRVRAAFRVREHPARAALRDRARRPGRRAAAGLGAGRRPARPRARLPSRGVRRQEPVLDGLVLPGARRRAARRRRRRTARRRLGHVRRTRPRRPLRQRPAVGDGRRNVRARARPRRLRPAGAGARGVRHRRAGSGTRTARTGPAGSTSTRSTFPPSASGWTSAAVVLAADALIGFSGGRGHLPRDSRPGRHRPPADPAACGCEATSALS